MHTFDTLPTITADCLLLSFKHGTQEDVVCFRAAEGSCLGHFDFIEPADVPDCYIGVLETTDLYLSQKTLTSEGTPIAALLKIPEMAALITTGHRIQLQVKIATRWHLATNPSNVPGWDETQFESETDGLSIQVRRILNKHQELVSLTEGPAAAVCKAFKQSTGYVADHSPVYGGPILTNVIFYHDTTSTTMYTRTNAPIHYAVPSQGASAPEVDNALLVSNTEITPEAQALMDAGDHQGAAALLQSDGLGASGMLWTPVIANGLQHFRDLNDRDDHPGSASAL